MGKGRKKSRLTNETTELENTKTSDHVFDEQKRMLTDKIISESLKIADRDVMHVGDLKKYALEYRELIKSKESD